MKAGKSEEQKKTDPFFKWKKTKNCIFLQNENIKEHWKNGGLKSFWIKKAPRTFQKCKNQKNGNFKYFMKILKKPIK